MTFWQTIQAHYVAIGVAFWFIFTSGVNALPPEGTAFVTGTWFMGFLREVAQQAPKKFPALTPEQQQVLKLHAAKTSESTLA